MKKLSTLIGAHVHTIHTSLHCGYVFSFTLNKSQNKINSILIANDELDAVYSVQTNNVFAFDSLVILKNETALSVIADSYPETMLNAQVFNINGTNLGRVIDIEFDDSFTLQKIITTLTTFQPNKIISHNNGTVFINTTDTHYSLSSFKPSKKSILQHTPLSVETLSSVPTPIEIQAKPNA